MGISENLSLAADYTRKAYELRDRTSEAEKYFITASYHMVVTGNIGQGRADLPALDTGLSSLGDAA